MATPDATQVAGRLPVAAGPPGLRAVPGVGAPLTSADADRRAARAFGEVLGRAGDRPGLDAVLEPAAEELCALVVADRCSIYLRGAGAGTFRGRLGFPATLDPVLRRLTLDVGDDPVLAETVRGRTPVLLPESAPERRPAGGAAVRRQHTGAVLAVPLCAGGRVLGVAFVEDRDRRRRFGAELESAAGTFAALLGRWMDRSLRVAELAAARDALTRERLGSERVARVERAISEAASGAPQHLADVIAGAADVVIELRDADAGLTYRAVPAQSEGTGEPASPGPRACHVAMGAVSGPDGQATAVVPQRSGDPDAGSFVVARTRCDGEAGPLFVLLLPRDGRPSASDRLIAERTAGALAVPVAPVPEADAATTGAVLAGLLGGGTTPEASAGLARRLGIDPDAPRIVVVATDVGPAAGVARSVLPEWSPVAVAVGAVTVLVLEVPRSVGSRHAAALVHERLTTTPDGSASPGLVVSAPSAGLIGLPRAFREAHGAALLVGPDVSTTVQRLGPARLLATDPADAGELAIEILGPLVGTDDDLLQTLRTFFTSAANVTATAGVLGLHANTIRHRFSRIRERTGLDVLGDVGDQHLAQTALIALGPPDRLADAPA